MAAIYKPKQTDTRSEQKPIQVGLRTEKEFERAEEQRAKALKQARERKQAKKTI